MPSISVVIPNFNYGRFIQDTVASVLRQTLVPTEIVIVDNGSTDNSREKIEGISDSRVKKVFQENRGQSGARNSALKLVTGDLVAFLDADDIWLPEKLALQVPLFSDPDVGLVYCGLRIVDPQLVALGVPDVLPKHRGAILERFALEVGAPVCGGESTAIMRRSLLEQSGEFDLQLSIGGGWDMWRRIASRSKVDFVPQSLVLYRQHGANLSRNLTTYAHDTDLKLKNMFSDPASRSVWPLKKKSYGIHLMAMAGAFVNNGQMGLAIFWGARAFLMSPTSIFRALAWPIRRIQRKFLGAKI